MIELFHLLIKKKGKEGFRIASLLLNENFPFFFKVNNSNQ